MDEAASAAHPDLTKARRLIAQARHVAALTGAGMSAESGVPTFRDAQTGLWAQFRAEELATEAAFRVDPQRVWRWYQYRRELIAAVEPNAGHRALAWFGKRHSGRLTLVTQNVDGLHQRAGSGDAIALHGSILQDRWLDQPRACCDVRNIEPGAPPRCPVCGNLRRPDVVWFGEALPTRALAAADEAARSCDLMLVIGTSGMVYPAAGLAHVARRQGALVVVINPAETELDEMAHLCVRERAAQCLPWLLGASH